MGSLVLSSLTDTDTLYPDIVLKTRVLLGCGRCDRRVFVLDSPPLHEAVPHQSCRTNNRLCSLHTVICSVNDNTAFLFWLLTSGVTATRHPLPPTVEHQPSIFSSSSVFALVFCSQLHHQRPLPNTVVLYYFSAIPPLEDRNVFTTHYSIVYL